MAFLTQIVPIEGYLLTKLEYKTITDYNESNNDGKHISALLYGTKYMIPKLLVDEILIDVYWSKYHSMIQNRMNGRQPMIYDITFTVLDLANPN